MSFKRQADRGEPFRFPRLGQRIVKTSVAVFLCLLFYYLRGYSGRDMPTEAAITAIICMQPYVRGTRDYALSRFAGTLLGAGCGLLFLFLLLLFPVLGQNLLVLYALMALAGIFAYAQDAQQAAANAAQELANAPQEAAAAPKPKYWTPSLEIALGLNQTNFENWAAGGFDNINFVSSIDAKEDFAKNLTTWNNRLQMHSIY